MTDPDATTHCRSKRPGLAVTATRRLQSSTQWWVRLNTPHTQKFGHSPIARYIRTHYAGTKPFVWTKPADTILSKLSRMPAPTV